MRSSRRSPSPTTTTTAGDGIAGRRFLIVENPSAGSATDELARRAATELPDATLLPLRPGVDLGAEVRAAIDDGRIVVACGGDGTIHSVVQHLVGTEGILGVLPGGTLNHFARDLGLRDPEVALKALRTGQVAKVDVGRVDGRIFVNTLAVGLYPELVRERERREDELGKWVALLLAVGRVLERFHVLRGTIAADGDRRGLQAAAVLVTSNRLSTTPGSIGARPRLDEGILEIRVLQSRGGVRGRLRIVWGMLMPGRRRVVRHAAREVEVSLGGRPRRIALDGEPDLLRRRIHVRVEPAALRVLAPDTAEQ
jgi:diacylglycerol kinase family enzyme